MATSASGVNDVSANKGITTSTAIKGKGVNDLTMDDFFKMMMSEMTNQDWFSESGGGSSGSSASMVTQLAQMSTMQGLQSILEYQQLSYSTSYIGQNVTIAQINATTGKMDTITGVVESVTFYDGAPQVIVNGKGYPLQTVMEINNPSTSGSSLNQAATYIGKQVTITDTDKDGMPYDVIGVVESVTLKGGQAYVTVNGKTYPVSSITDVASVSKSEESSDSTGNTDSTENTGSTEEEGSGSGLDTDDE